MKKGKHRTQKILNMQVEVATDSFPLSDGEKALFTKAGYTPVLDQINKWRSRNPINLGRVYFGVGMNRKFICWEGFPVPMYDPAQHATQSRTDDDWKALALRLQNCEIRLGLIENKLSAQEKTMDF